MPKRAVARYGVWLYGVCKVQVTTWISLPRKVMVTLSLETLKDRALST